MSEDAGSHKSWIFTINTYTHQDVEEVYALQAKANVLYAAYELESRPHIQGYITLKRSMRRAGLSKLIKRASIRKANGSKEQNERYILMGYKKQDDGTEVLKDFNIPFLALERSSQGDRSDIKEAVEVAVKHGLKRAAEEHPEVVVKYHKGIKEVAKLLLKVEVDADPPPQQAMDWFNQNFSDPPDARTIHWVYDQKGGWGKSLLTDWILDNKEAIDVMGQTQHIAQALRSYQEENGGKSPVYVIFDIPKTKMSGHTVNYEAMEFLKNGRIFCPKWDSRTLRFKRPHVIVFANEIPDPLAFSEDRIKLHTV